MVPILTAIVLALLGAAGGAYEAALLAASRSRLEELLEERGAQPSRFLSGIVSGDPTARLSAAVLHAVGNGAFLLYALAVWLAPLADVHGWTAPRTLLVALAFLLVTVLLRSAGTLAGAHEAEALVLAAAGPVWLLTLPLRPVVRAMLVGSRVLARGFGLEATDNGEESEERIIAAVSDASLDGLVAEEQREMIEGIFHLKDADVADVITPRTEMVSVQADAPIATAIQAALENGHSRLPVHETTRDEIVGIFHVRDALPFWGRDPKQAPRLRDILRPPVFVPETKSVSQLLTEMQRDKTHMAIVLDEYGGTAGLVTIEDVLEEIVGEIHDEFDVGEEAFEIRAIDAHTLVADGQAHVSEINEALDEDLIPEDDDFETAGGFVLDRLGHIPKAGESFEEAGLQFKVLAADARRIRRIQIRRTGHDDDAS